MRKVKTLAVLNFIFFFIACLTANLSQTKIFGGVTNADISNKYETVFTPAGITFAIWGVIYLSLFGFTIYHLISAYNDDVDSEANKVVLKINYLFIINNIATAIWVFSFTYEYLLASMLLIIIQLITLLIIAIRLNLFDVNKSFKNKLFTQFPLSIYFAWLCVANVANISLFLVSVGWNGFGISESVWAIILIIITLIIAIFIIFFKRNPFFGLVILWAIYGIYLKRMQIDELLYENVIKLCSFSMGVLGILILGQFYKNAVHKKINA